MSEPIERLRFYERQYLRSADFIAEQNYHLEMRRRLNRALHLWGIVDGLEIRFGKVIDGGPDEFYVTPGMAIDGFGRELFLAAPWPLSAADFAQGQFNGAGDFVVWAVYRRSSETPAAAGYRLCNAKDQLTRWRESIGIIISNTVPATVAPPFDETPPDDPKAEWPIRLGMIYAVSDKNSPVITAISAPARRTYIGLRAQHLTSPTLGLEPLHADFNLPFQVAPDLRAEKDLIVGKDFPIVKMKVKPVPTEPPLFPGTEGNVRIANHLFLTGEFYKDQGGGNWVALKEYIRTLLPDIHFGIQTVPVISTGGDPSCGTFPPFPVTSTLEAPQSRQVFAAISGITLKNKVGLKDWFKKISPASPWMFQLTASAALQSNSTNTVDISLHWEVDPNYGVNGSQIVSIDSLLVSYIVVFQP